MSLPPTLRPRLVMALLLPTALVVAGGALRVDACGGQGSCDLRVQAEPRSVPAGDPAPVSLLGDGVGDAVAVHLLPAGLRLDFTPKTSTLVTVVMPASVGAGDYVLEVTTPDGRGDAAITVTPGAAGAAPAGASVPMATAPRSDAGSGGSILAGVPLIVWAGIAGTVVVAAMVAGAVLLVRRLLWRRQLRAWGIQEDL